MGYYPAVPTLTYRQACRFRAKVQRGGEDECWPWIGAQGRDGRGQVRINTVCYTASRVALALATGQDLEGLVAMHSCDYPPCCNPAHLSAVTQSVNLADAFTKGRHSPPGLRGEACGTSKLTQEVVDRIRQLYNQGAHTQRKLAIMFGVTQANIWAIVNNKTWVRAAQRIMRTRNE